ncbi:hypothetical protein KSS87_000640 [Heliosperma pusillum]|nr:hypothetical protein KSS87_000640 [Heliosperma pusillum]
MSIDEVPDLVGKVSSMVTVAPGFGCDQLLLLVLLTVIIAGNCSSSNRHSTMAAWVVAESGESWRRVGGCVSVPFHGYNF